MKFLGKIIDTNKWHSGNSIIDWENGEVSLGTAGHLERVHKESVSYHFGDTDAKGKEVYTGHILRHLVTLETLCYMYEPTKRVIAVITEDDTYTLSELPDGFLDDYEIFAHNFDFPKPEQLKPVDENTTTSFSSVITTEDYWDCNCETNYIHPKSIDKCKFCDAHRDDQPDSRENEVAEYLVRIKPEPIDYEAKEHQGVYADDDKED